MKQYIKFSLLAMICFMAAACQKTVEVKEQLDTRKPTKLTDFALHEMSVGDYDFIITPPKSNSPAPIHYKSSNTTVATIRDDKWISAKSAGDTYITAYQEATTDFKADSIKVLFTVGKRKPSFIGFPDMTKLKTDPPFVLIDPVSKSTGKFVYSSDNTAVAIVSGNTISIKGAGTAKITYTQQAAGDYSSLSASFLLTVTETNPVFGTMTDIDGNVYKTIKIGNQTWMAENLKVTHYRNGDVINLVTDETKWFGLTNGGYCNYNNDETIAKEYGRLYNYYAVIDSRKLTPAGWHVPTDTEWQELYKFIGSVREQGLKLKEMGTTHWSVDIGTNSTNFTALGAGGRVNFDKIYTYGFQYLKTYGYWWSSTPGTAKTSVFYSMYSKGYLEKDEGDNTIGLSIRCIKD